MSTSEDSDSEMGTPIEYRMPNPLKLDSVEDMLPKWNSFKQQLKIFISAAGLEKVTDNRKASILLNCIGQEGQDLYFNVLKSSEDSTPKYEELLKLFDDYFKPKQNELISTFNFFKREQLDGETFDNFYSEIRRLVKNCNFENESRMLRDRIVMGVYDKRVQQKLLEDASLTLDKAVDKCRSMELAKEHGRAMQKQEEAAAVDELQTASMKTSLDKAKYSRNISNKKSTNKYSGSFYHCLKCNREHGPRQCPAFGKTCAKCQKLNHFAAGCKSKSINTIEVENQDVDNSVQDL